MTTFQEAFDNNETHDALFRKIAHEIAPLTLWREFQPNPDRPPESKRIRNSFINWGKNIKAEVSAFMLLIENSDYLLNKQEEPISEYSENQAIDTILATLYKLDQNAYYYINALMLGNGFVPKSSSYFEELAIHLEGQGLVQKYKGAGAVKIKLTINGRKYVEEILEKAQQLNSIKRRARIQLGDTTLQFISSLKDLLILDRIEEVCDHLHLTVNNTDLRDNLIMIYGTLNFAKKNRDLGISTSEDYNVKRSQIRQALLNFLNNLTDSDLILN